MLVRTLDMSGVKPPDPTRHAVEEPLWKNAMREGVDLGRSAAPCFGDTPWSRIDIPVRGTHPARSVAEFDTVVCPSGVRVLRTGFGPVGSNLSGLNFPRWRFWFSQPTGAVAWTYRVFGSVCGDCDLEGISISDCLYLPRYRGRVCSHGLIVPRGTSGSRPWEYGRIGQVDLSNRLRYVGVDTSHLRRHGVSTVCKRSHATSVAADIRAFSCRGSGVLPRRPERLCAYMGGSTGIRMATSNLRSRSCDHHWGCNSH